jgi:hypothetical protein
VNRGSIPGADNRISSSQNHPERVWVTLGKGVLSTRVK